jgi:CheY-like chemotaxis protein
MPPHPPESIPAPGQRSILVVDDQEDLREILQAKLRAAGYHVVTAGNGREAIAALAGAKFDLVLTDVLMPEQDGVELVIAMRKLPGAPPVIAMSGGGRVAAAEYLRIARGLGAVAIIEKPFSDEQLLLSIALALPPAI